MSRAMLPHKREDDQDQLLSKLASGRRFGQRAQQALKASAARLGRGSANAAAYEAEAGRLEQGFYDALAQLALANPRRGVIELPLELPDELRRTPFDALFSLYRQVAGHEPGPANEAYHLFEPRRDHFRPASALNGWLRDSAELAEAGRLHAQAYSCRHSDYSTLACASCHRLSGWLAADGRCDYCVLAAQALPLVDSGTWYARRWPDHERFLQLLARYERARDAEYAAIKRGPGARSGRLRWLLKGQAHDQARLLAWGKETLELLPDCAPATPLVGYELWLPERFELDAVDGSDVLVHFWATRYRWDGSQFTRLGARLPQYRVNAPTAFPSSLAPSALASAWYDFKLAVAAVNRSEWQERQATSQARSDRALAASVQRDELDTRRGATALLEA